MIKGFTNWATIILLVCIFVFQFILPFAIVDNSNLSAFAVGMKYWNVHWAFNFFWIISGLVISSLLLLYFASKKEHGKLYLYLSFLFVGGFFLGVSVLASLQSFLYSNPNIGINDHSGDGVVTFLAFIVLFFLQAPRWHEHTKESAEKLLKTQELENFLRDKKVIYEDTILLEPSFWITLKHPNPLKFVATEKEFVVGSQPILVLPFKSILKVKFNAIFNMKIRIHMNDGKVHKIMWAPVEKYQPYNVMATSQLGQNIKDIINKYK